MKTERNYGIDLLRLVLMFMVCMLHTLSQGGILRAYEAGTTGYYTFWFLEIFSYCAVDAFAIISGYMAADRPQRYEKLLDLWSQAFFYSFVLTLIFTLLNMNGQWELSDMIGCAMPVTHRKFWYFSAFFVLFFAMPVINRFVFSISEATAGKTLVVLMILFPLVSLLDDPFKVMDGYTPIWIMVMYTVGALSQRAKLFARKKAPVLLLLWACCIFLTWSLFVFGGEKKLINYTSPTIVISGLVMVILFSRLRLKGTLIAKLSPLAFGIYLFQCSPVVWAHIKDCLFPFVSGRRTLIGLFFAFAFASALFIAGLLVEFLRRAVSNRLRLPALHRAVVARLRRLLEKSLVLLK
ncbi:MAG: acyltransferase [Oscillospiraceae bacterium]|nr:acyltransferase [Oscillospiraceae bacterium]